MVKWLNRAVYQMPRNGTTSHTIDPTSSTNLVDGAAFTPTSGRLLVVVIGGAVTSTTPSGWTLPTNGSAINNTGLYVFTKTAASGSNSFSTTHNGSNYPIVAAVYEFPAGSTFVKSATAVSVAWDGANPNLTSLTGTNLVMAVKEKGTTAATPSDYTWTGTGTPTKDWMYYIFSSPTDGYETSLAYVEGYTGSSWQPTGTFSENTGTFEALTFAINVAAGSMAGNITADTPTVIVAVPTLAWTGAAAAPQFAGTVAADTPAVAVDVPTVAWSGTVTVPQSAGTITADLPTVTVDVPATAWAGTVTLPTSAGTIDATTPTVTIDVPTVAWTGTATAPGAVAGTITADTPTLTVDVPTATWSGTVALPTYSGGIDATAPTVTVAPPTTSWSGAVLAPPAGSLVADTPPVSIAVPTVAWAGTVSETGLPSVPQVRTLTSRAATRTLQSRMPTFTLEGRL